MVEGRYLLERVNMNYRRHYELLIKKAQKRGIDRNIYTENHHILPKSEGGADEKSNLVRLYPREHFIAHWLLYRENPTVARAYAFNMMSCDRNNTYRASSRAYAEGVEAAAIACSENQKGRIGINRDGRVKYVYSYELDIFFERGWSRGGLQSEKTKGRFWSNNGEEQVLSTTLKEGWKKGRIKEGATTGRKAISKEGVVKFVNNPEEWIIKGWSLGNEKYYPGYLHLERNKKNRPKDW